MHHHIGRILSEVVDTGLEDYIRIPFISELPRCPLSSLIHPTHDRMRLTSLLALFGPLLARPPHRQDVGQDPPEYPGLGAAAIASAFAWLSSQKTCVTSIVIRSPRIRWRTDFTWTVALQRNRIGSARLAPRPSAAVP